MIRRRRRLWLATLVVVLVGLGVALLIPRDAPPPIVLISVDTLRADHLSAYGYSRPTPHLDALAREGVLYREAHAAAPWTLPSHMSLLTGRYPSSHGVVDDDRRLGQGTPTLAEALERRGYRCAAFVSHTYLDARFGFQRGFGDRFSYRQYLNAGVAAPGNVLGDVTVDEATRYLDASQNDERPYFLFVHLFDPHWTYAAPKPFGGRYSSAYRGPIDGTIGGIIEHIDVRRKRIADADLQQLMDLYDEEVAWVDHLIGVLVERIRALPGGDRAVFIVTSDHGEEFLEHGSLGHATTLYREQTHVPLIIADPRSSAGGHRIAQPVSNVDVAPTICEMAGVDPADPFLVGLDGAPLPLAPADPGAAAVRPIVMETTRWGPPRQAVLHGRHKCIAPMAYDWIGQRRRDGRIEKLVVASWNRPLEIYRTDQDLPERAPLQLGGADPAARAATQLLGWWRQQTWRGILLEFQVPGPWRGRFQLAQNAVWRDEPQLTRATPALHETRELAVADGVVDVTLPGAGSYRLHLPVDPASAGRLTVRPTEGSIFFDYGDTAETIGVGQTIEVDLGGDSIRPQGARQVPYVSLATRPYGVTAEAAFSEEALRVLESIGYLRR